jgi:glutathione S-transferase
MLTLYHSEPNTFSLKALIALNEKSIEFNSVYQDWTRFEQFSSGPKPNLESANNPENEGPLLDHDGKVISESFFMLEYLEDAFPNNPPKLLPGDPEGNWRVRMWGRLLGESTAPAITTLGCHKYLAPVLKERRLNSKDPILEKMATQERKVAWAQALDDSYTEEVLEDSRRKLKFAVSRLEEQLGKTPWLAGSNYSISDIEAFSLLMSAPKLVSDAFQGAPKLTALMAKVKERPAVKKALAMSKTGKPDEAFAPGPEHARWG